MSERDPFVRRLERDALIACGSCTVAAFVVAGDGLRAAAGRDSVMVVLGDARGNWTDPQGWAFEQLAQACRRVIWLVPEPAVRWDTGDSALSEYLPWCDVVCEASDLDGLGRGVAEIIRSL